MLTNSIYALLLAGVFSLFSYSAYAADYYVETTGSDSGVGTQVAPFKTIQKAVNTATHDDIVHIGKGEYKENFVITDKSLTLIGNGRNSTIILPLPNKSGIQVKSEKTIISVSISDLAILGKADSGSNIVSERCIEAIGGPTLTINNVGFYGCVAKDGAALYTGGPTTIKNSDFNNNVGKNGGSIVLCFGADFPILIDNTSFSFNVSEPGSDLTKPTYILLIEGSSVISNSLFEDNQGTPISNSGDLTIINTSIAKNTGANHAGAILNFNKLTVINSTISDNKTYYVVTPGKVKLASGGIAVDDVFSTAFVHLYNTTIYNNKTIGQDQDDLVGENFIFEGAKQNVIFRNSVIAKISSAGKANCKITLSQDTVLDASNSFDSDGSCGFAAENGNIVGSAGSHISPMLDALTSYNGSMLMNGITSIDSPLLDAGNPAGCVGSDGAPLAFDQRGVDRHLDGDGNGEKICDIGAYEAGLCGDAVKDPAEPCDDGNEINTDSCLTTCKLNTCGDGFLNTGVEACDDNNTAAGDGCSATCTLEDFDNDGYHPAPYGTDCNDNDGLINPGASELCDNKDNNCNSQIDENALDMNIFYLDSDSDGYGSVTQANKACFTPPSGYVANSQDCNDEFNTIHPGADEICDSVDNNCNGTVDEATAVDVSTWWQDFDKDGFGSTDPVRSKKACTAPAGYIAASGDCKDNDNTIYPNASEVCDGRDNNCSGHIDESGFSSTLWYKDGDSDGYGDKDVIKQQCVQPDGYSVTSTDCDDTASSINPGAAEVCNNKDDDCDGDVDNNPANGITYYLDGDNDGYGLTDTTTVACQLPANYAEFANDCNDTNASINPGADEICGNGIDENCDGGDISCGAIDADGDGFSSDDGDCNDGNASIYPGATEVCDGLDNDCNGVDDNVADAPLWYSDSDGDGYGNDSSTIQACSKPAGYVDLSGDCDEANAGINPAAAEICSDGIDQNCSGADLSCDTVDQDSDGYHKCAPGELEGCDCNDNDSSVLPGAAELCNGVDDDCDGDVDETGDVSQLLWWHDIDGDGYGFGSDPENIAYSCTQPDGYVLPGVEDCHDGAVSIHPGAVEICGNDVDENCDGVDLSCTAVDADGDGYTAKTGDCDETNALIYTGAPEVCNGLDNDCNGVIDDHVADAPIWHEDSDGDGYGSLISILGQCEQPEGYVEAINGTDCDDGAAGINPSAVDICGDGIDQNCDGSDLACKQSGDASGSGSASSGGTSEDSGDATPSESGDSDSGDSPTSAGDAAGAPAASGGGSGGCSLTVGH